MADTPTGDVDYRPDGTIRFDGRIVRRPKLGEFRDLRERFYELADMRPPDDAPDPASPEGKQARRSHAAVVEAACVDWFRAAAKLLGFDLPSDDDDLPMWMLDATVLADWITHWRTVPLRSGVAQAPATNQV